MSPHLVLRVVSKLLIPLIIIFGLYVHFHGDYSPGGGFQAGVIVASAVILYALIFGVDHAKRAVPTWFVKFLAAFGVLLFGGTGVATLILGANFLDYDVLHPDLAHHSGQHIGIILVELGVLSTVFAVIMAIFYAFAGRAPDIPEGEW
ncbi:Na(+)/H(+) antiporter subunit B [Hyphobacterium sp. CCMP332]|jgi:multicomponent Na+:H+ antiporter subunit B|uniref:Na(+)/H(+) antiporter subunit B n=1 Tax=Hyphobacterium sp. CCMP332 TaxID=2749086 RepID=UPI001650ADAE|nr:Na(+)/H(+) antiporter subunit B [Hyphobacterium sp. CCMP332]QNL19163.1 Na(+)/H(+) antiporter subunit B [Hyphobacterium sp. CCMP332]